MLVLSRKVGEEIILRHKGEEITVKITRLIYRNENAPYVGVGITAPPSVNIVRAEIDDHRETRQ